MKTSGSIGVLAQNILEEVKKDHLIKMAAENMAGTTPPVLSSEVGQLLQKFASLLRSKNETPDVTVGDVENFMREIRDAN